ncbi:MAG: hypothetical protein R3C11_00375 [Planctomycetaceae bacterium]
MRAIPNQNLFRIAATILCALSVSTDIYADEKDLLRSSKGSGSLYEKLVVQSNKAFLVDEPTLDATRRPTPTFNIFFRLKTDTPNNEQNGYYRVGKRDGTPVGWIKKDFVTQWNTRFGIEPALPQPDRHFVIYKDGKATTPHLEFIGKAGQIPDGARRFALIVDTPREETEEVFPVVVFTGEVDSSGAKQKEQMALYNLQLEIVYLIDTTGSMTPLIEVAQDVASIRKVSLRNARGERVVHFGLIEYRDAPQCTFAF